LCNKKQKDMAIKIINENVTVDTEATLSANDKYWSNFHQTVLTVVNDNHAKGLNNLNSNIFGTLTERDFNWKVID